MRLMLVVPFAVLVGCGVGVAELDGVPDDLATTQDELSSPNGMTLNGFSKNGLSKNGFSQNGLSKNGFSKNGMGLSKNGLTTIAPGMPSTLDPAFATWFNADARSSAEFLKYFYRCALPADSKAQLGPSSYTAYLSSLSGCTNIVTINGVRKCARAAATTDCAIGSAAAAITITPNTAGGYLTMYPSAVVGAAGTPATCAYRFAGGLGLAPNVAQGLPMTTDEQELVSACLGAHVNAVGASVSVSMRVAKFGTVQTPNIGLKNARPFAVTGATNVIASDATERGTYTTNEGAFWGNLFAPPYKIFACRGAMNGPIGDGVYATTTTTSGFSFPAFNLDPAKYPLTPGRGQFLLAQTTGDLSLWGTCQDVCGSVLNESGQRVWSACTISPATANPGQNKVGTTTPAGDAMYANVVFDVYGQGSFTTPRFNNVVTTYLPTVTCKPTNYRTTNAATCCSGKLNTVEVGIVFPEVKAGGVSFSNQLYVAPAGTACQ